MGEMGTVTAQRDLDDLEIAVDAAHAAGDAVRSFFRTELAVEYKSPDQPVTRADRDADTLLRQRLMGERPRYGWLSEETADSDERLACHRVWIVDPVDGTSSFVEGIPEFVIAVGVAEQGKARVGVVHDPMARLTYTAVAGGGAFRGNERIRVARQRSEPRLLVSRSAPAGMLERALPGWRLQRVGSTANKLVHLAAGAGEGYLTRAERAEWDLCAAGLILEEAGGCLSALDGSPFTFNRPDPRVRGVVAGSRDGYRRLRKHLQKLDRE